jgi:hypothetical protein
VRYRDFPDRDSHCHPMGRVEMVQAKLFALHRRYGHLGMDELT